MVFRTQDRHQISGRAVEPALLQEQLGAGIERLLPKEQAVCERACGLIPDHALDNGCADILGKFHQLGFPGYDHQRDTQRVGRPDGGVGDAGDIFARVDDDAGDSLFRTSTHIFDQHVLLAADVAAAGDDDQFMAGHPVERGKDAVHGFSDIDPAHGAV